MLICLPGRLGQASKTRVVDLEAGAGAGAGARVLGSGVRRVTGAVGCSVV